MRRALLVCILVASGISLVAQEHRAPVVGVAIDSSDGRIQNWSPGLRKEAADVVQKVLKNATVELIGVHGKEIDDAANKRGIDYLITIELSPRPYAEVSFGGPGTQDPEITGHPRANANGTVFLSWTVRALNGKAFKLHDSRMVQASEYPLDPNFDWLRVIASRSVRDGAAAAATKLKKKAGL